MTSNYGIDKTLPILLNTLIAPIEGEVCAVRHRATFVSPGRIARARRARACGAPLLVLMCLCGALGCAAHRPAPPPAEQVSQYASIRSIAILPPQVEVYSVALGGANEHLSEHEGQITTELIDLVTRQFAEQGRTVQTTTIGTKPSDQSAQLFQESWLRESYKYISEGLHPSPQTLENTLYGVSLGDEAKKVAHELGSDGLILVRCHAEQRTGGSVGAELAGKVLVGMATAGLFVPPADPAGRIVVDAALVNGKSGDIVWANWAGDFKMAFMGSAFDKTVLEGVMKRLFATLLGIAGTSARSWISDTGTSRSSARFDGAHKAVAEAQRL